MVTVVIQKLTIIDGVQRTIEYTLPNFKRFSYDINSPITPAALPEEGAEENVLVKMEGNSAQMNLSWKLKDLDANAFADVTPGDNKTIQSQTVAEQMQYFKTFFASKSITDAFQIRIEYPNNTMTWDGSVTKIHFDTADGENLTFNASITFMEGNIVVLYEIDVPSAPRNITFSSITSSGFTVNWDVPFDSGAEAINDYRVSVIKEGGSWQDFDVGSATTSKAVTGLDAGTIYTVQVKAKSDLGFGRPSAVELQATNP